MAIQMHPDLQSLTPPLSPEEAAQLEANLLEEGCLDPLIVWQEEQLLLDGHNRLAICERHELLYTVQELNLPSLDAAKAWIIAHQLGRRNLTPDQMSYYRGKHYEMQKRQGKRTDLTSPQSDGKSHDTAQVLAAQHTVGKATIERDGAYARAVDTIAAAVGPEARQAILARQTKVTQQDVKALAKLATQSTSKAKAREVQEHAAWMDSMIRSTTPEAEWPVSLRPRPTPTPEMEQRAWDQVYVEELGRRLTKALDSLDHLHTHLAGTSDDQDWLTVTLPALLEQQSARAITLARFWGQVEMLLRRSETVLEGIFGSVGVPSLRAASGN